MRGGYYPEFGNVNSTSDQILYVDCARSFRVLVVTDLLSQDPPLEDMQYLNGHANPRTTQIYDHRRRSVTRNVVERISE